MIKWKRSANHLHWHAEVGQYRISVNRNDSDVDKGYDDWRWRLDRIERGPDGVTRAMLIREVKGRKEMRKAKEEAEAALRALCP